MLIRPEEEKDWVALHALNKEAFESPTEAHLVDALCQQASPVVSLVAEENHTIVGHIMFSPVWLIRHLGYYPHFGFVLSTRFGIGCEYEVPEEAVMSIELLHGYLQGKPGTVKYPAAFAGV